MSRHYQKRIIALVICLFGIIGFGSGWLWPGGIMPLRSAQAGEIQETKAEKIFRIRQRARLNKPSSFVDRKIGRMDNGRMVMYYDNNGFIGDRDYTRSIEWPAGTLNYLVWQVGIIFGAVTAEGDTISSESFNDISDNQFNPEPGYDNPNYVSSILQTQIVARSDIIESYSPSWNGLWPGLAGSFVDPAILRNLACQESYWLMRDDNDPEVSAEPPLHVQVECRLIQINSRLTRDFIFAFYKVTNVSGAPLSACRFGVLVDPDVPALVGAEFEDDDDGFVKDLNLAYARDSDNFYASKPGFNIGHFGTKFLRSPEVNGQELGLTAWTTFEYGDMPAPGEFYLTEEGPDENGPTLQSRDHAQYHYMQPGLFMKPRLNTDVGYLMSSGDFELADGESVEMGVAFIAAPDFDGLLRNADAAQRIYDNNFVGPTAPAPPAVTAVPGNHTVTLYWDDAPSESSTDAFTFKPDFEGYRIYRSRDRGQTWGETTQLEDIYPIGFVPIADFDQFNTTVAEISGVVVSHNNSLPGASNAVIVSAGLADGSQGGDAGEDLSGAFSGDTYTIEFQTDSTFRVNNITQPVRLSYLASFLDEDGNLVNQGKGFTVLDTAFTILPGVDDLTGQYASGNYIYLDGVFVQIVDNFADSTKDATVNAGEIFRIEQKKIDPGANLGLRHHWTDPDELVNGYEYWYTVTAYDRPDLEIGVPVNETQPATVADAFLDDQTVSVFPMAPPAGFVEAEAPTASVFDHPSGIAHVEGFPLIVVDPRLVRDATYAIRFTETDDGKLWSLFDVTGGANTPLQEQNSQYDPFVDNVIMFDGMVLHVNDLEAGINGDLSSQTAVAGNDTLSLDFDPTSYGDYVWSETHTEKDYEIRFTSSAVRYPTVVEDTTSRELATEAPFEVYEVTDGAERRITVRIYDDVEDTTGGAGHWSIDESFDFINVPYSDPATVTHGDDDLVYYLTLAVSDTTGEVDVGNVYRLIGNRRLHASDEYRFTTQAQRLDPTEEDLSLIRVVPNPFIVTSGFDTGRDRHEIHFTRLPAECKIQIFTLTGELVKIIDHNRATGGLDFARWDLKTEFGSEVAYGVYLYHIDSSAGEKMGKFAIMR